MHLPIIAIQIPLSAVPDVASGQKCHHPQPRRIRLRTRKPPTIDSRMSALVTTPRNAPYSSCPMWTAESRSTATASRASMNSGMIEITADSASPRSLVHHRGSRLQRRPRPGACFLEPFLRRVLDRRPGGECEGMRRRVRIIRVRERGPTHPFECDGAHKCCAIHEPARPKRRLPGRTWLKERQVNTGEPDGTDYRYQVQ